ncbi:hypothetical protein A7K91_04925 [Paenibacillus oryzae]|uniref:Uncharacterized protein n=1 Tax=Paenibacillus oryzae TaxID=1844972 RepID=A0A1A5YGZ7_9BACL|nr:hypothetical protein [Paenibacillus oryzae]OBR64926.1 hypothetical protein A7K91_04925 [Paenibacillus oryzae]
MLANISPYSIVEQDYTWIGEYIDGTCLYEYDINTKQRSDFYSIKRDKLIRFGLIGHGMRLYYEVGGGFFKLNGSLYEIVYRVGNKEYYLTGQFHPYNDVIAFKDAEAWSSRGHSDTHKFPTRITAFNFGWKTKLDVSGVQFSIKAIVTIPYNAPVNLQVSIVADTDLEGQLLFKKNGTEISEFETPLKKGVGGKLMWAVR